MKYKITHTTRYNYSETVPVCQNLVFLTPRKTPYQTCLRHRMTIRPQVTTLHRRMDYFGNTANLFSIDGGHRRLQITAKSTVEIGGSSFPEPAGTGAWETVRDGLPRDRTPEGLAAYQYAFSSPHVPLLTELAEYAATSFTPRRPTLEALVELNHRIYSDFTYDPKATTINTPISEVFEKRRGVCQDLAHLMLGCLRPLGLAARYVSGYLRTVPPAGQPRLVGADASHAWISVDCGEHGWIDVDPTNDVLPQTDHITLAWGRDFSDVCPVAGMFVGGGAHELAVSVDVALE